MNIEVYEIDLIILDDNNSLFTTFVDKLEAVNKGTGLVEFRDTGKRTSVVVDLRDKNISYHYDLDYIKKYDYIYYKNLQNHLDYIKKMFIS